MDRSDLDRVVDLASKWQDRANMLITKEEKANQKKLQLLVRQPLDKAFLTKLIDQCFRSKSTVRIADQITYLLRRSSFPEFLSLWDVLLMWLFLSIGRHFPKIVVPLIIERIRKDSGKPIIPGEPRAFNPIMKKLRDHHTRMNLTRLAPPAMGEEEVNRRLKAIIADLHHPYIDYISVKVSSLCAQFRPFAYDEQLNQLIERLAAIFREALSSGKTASGNPSAPSFVNLDLDDANELEIIVAAFTQTLEQEAFRNYPAGIVLQAYLPDAFSYQQRLTEWAIERCRKGGSPIKIRIVKGANLEMEKIKSSLNRWPLATYDTKIDVDANFKRMIEYGLQQERFRSVRLGIASHNIFELAFGFHVAQQAGASEFVDMEMLYGVAGNIQRAIKEDTQNLVLYAPVARKNEFINTIGYLIRRLDENTARDSFLRYAVGITTDSEEWQVLKHLFTASYHHIQQIESRNDRAQNRLTDQLAEKIGTYHRGKFHNESFTDWSLRANRKWAANIRDQWMGRQERFPLLVPLIIDGEVIEANRPQQQIHDPSFLPGEIEVATVTLGQSVDVEKAVISAKTDPDLWHEKTPAERHEVLSRVAHIIRSKRSDLMGAITATTGKSLVEADREISTAIDYVEYYPHSVKTFIEPRNMESGAKGLAAVIGSRIAPLADACNGIAAALATGNTVILKPSTKAALPAWILCHCFWEGGISQKTLQFLPGFGPEIGMQLAVHPDISFVILNGRQPTARQILKNKPETNLISQTRGKNAIIVTAVSDREAAIGHIIESAFLDGGQKTSSISLLILEKEVYKDKGFKQQLIDAARTIAVGSSWDFKTRVGPLAIPPNESMLKALTELEAGEEWALKPGCSDQNPLLWTPGIKWNVQPDSFAHLEETATPLLNVMCADTFPKAVVLANQPGFALASGLESLDKPKQEYWKQNINAGNLFINGRTIDIHVARQPFGGWESSSVRQRMKAGGPNYVAQFMDFHETGSPAEVATKYDRPLIRLAKNWIRKTDRSEFKPFEAEIQKAVRAMNSYLYHARHQFRMEKDFFHLRGQDNIIRYLPLGRIAIRVHRDDTLFEILARIAAAQTAKCKCYVSIPLALDNQIISFLKKRERREFLRQIKLVYETDDELIASMENIACIRYASPERVPPGMYRAAFEKKTMIAADGVLMEGRIELLHYYRSQSISHNYHRYGNLGTRAFDQSMESVRGRKIR